MSAQSWKSKANRVTIPASEGLGLGELTARVVEQVRQDHISAFAGNLAYRSLFSLFAILILALTLLGIFGARHLIDTMINQLSPIIPKSLQQSLQDQILSNTKQAAPGAPTLGAVISVVAALYGLSATARAVIRAMNAMYEVTEGRGLIKRYVASVLMALAVLAVFVGAVLILGFGPQIGSWLASLIGLGGVFETVWQFLKWPVVFALVLLGISLTYWLAPAVEIPFRWISHGSVVAVVLWIAFTFAFVVFVANFGNYSATYGALAGIIVFLLFMFFSSLILLVGAEVNDIVNRHRQGGKRPQPAEGSERTQHS